MKRTKSQLIHHGKWWRITQNNVVLFEGMKTHCRIYLAENGLMRLHERGDVKMELVKP